MVGNTSLDLRPKTHGHKIKPKCITFVRYMRGCISYVLNVLPFLTTKCVFIPNLVGGGQKLFANIEVLETSFIACGWTSPMMHD